MTPDKNPPPEMFEMSVSLTPEELAETALPLEMFAPLTEEEIEVRRDMEWAYNDPETQQRYRDKIVAIYRRKVVAVGEEWGKVRDEAARVTGVHRNHIALVAILGPSILEL